MSRVNEKTEYYSVSDLGKIPDEDKFVKIPKAMLGKYTKFPGLSLGAVYLYSLLRDRQELADRYNDPESDGRRPIYFTVEEAMKVMNCGNKKAIRVFRELEERQLIERKRQGMNRPNKIYVRDILRKSYPQVVSK